MASILMGSITALIVIGIGISAFYIGFKQGERLTKLNTTETASVQLSDLQQKRQEGFANIINHCNRHQGGGNK